MDSYYPDQLSKDTEWEEVEQVPLPSTEPEKKSGYKNPQQSKTNNLKTTLHENETLMDRLSVALRHNMFMESKIQSIESRNKKLTDKNIFLQDQFLILKEKHQNLTQKNFHFTKNLHNNSEDLKKLKSNINSLKNQFQNTREEKTHALKLNRHLIQKITELSKQNKNTIEKNTNLKNENTKIKKVKSLVPELEKNLTETKKNHSKEINQLNKVKQSEIKNYQNIIQTLNKSATDKQKRHLSEIAKLKNQIQQNKWSQKKTEDKAKKIKNLNNTLAHYLTKMSKKGEFFQEWNKNIVQKNEKIWKEKTKKLVHQHEKKTISFKRRIRKTEPKNNKKIIRKRISYRKNQKTLLRFNCPYPRAT